MYVHQHNVRRPHRLFRTMRDWNRRNKQLFNWKFVAGILVVICGSVGQACAGTIFWTDWQSQGSGTGFIGLGTITTSTATVSVTYNNPQGIAFFQTGSGTDYFQNGLFNGGRNPATSPYTSNLVDNIPTAAEMIALRFAGSQSLSFSESIANPVFSYVSLNGNGYAFDQDFEILSVGGVDGNSPGYWGSGTSFKQVVGNEYRLLGTGEPHGTIRFTGSFSTVTWRSLSNEFWNGFTVGIQGTSTEVFAAVPEPSSVACWSLLGLTALGRSRRRKS
jgi:hypothetical protein